jgi:integrase/recombinase XerC
LTLAEIGLMIQALLRDKSYRATPIGLLVGRYVRWCRNERGLVDATTIRDYEGTLAKMSLTLSNLEPRDVTIEDLRTVIDLWADREPRTRKKVTSAIRSFWTWAEDEGYVERSPAAKLRSPKAPNHAPDLLPQAVDTQLLSVAQNERDLLALIVLLDLGIRKAELRGIMVRDFDLSRRTLTVFGKGQKGRVLPLRGRIIHAAEAYMRFPLPEFTQTLPDRETERERVSRTPEPTDYLLYPEWRKGGRVYKARPKDPMPQQTLHRWWYEHLQRAGLVEADVERGMNMHRARHTFATELRRDSGDLGVVQRMLGHSDSRTTEQFYGHYDLSDLERAMERFAEERR